MKFFLLLVSVLALQTTFHAQTLTAANFNPIAGEEFIYDAPYTAYTVSPGGSGAGQLWDFSALLVTSYQDYNLQVPSGVLPGIFSSATFKRKKTSVSTNDFFNTNSTSLNYLGYMVGSGPTAIITEYTDPETIMVYPFSLNSAHTDTWADTTLSPYTSTTTILGDATGTLITPYATYTNVLRVFSVQTITTTTTNRIAQTYNWYTPGIHGEIMSLYTYTYTKPSGTTKDGGVYVYKHRDTTSVSTVGLNNQKQNENKVSVFPNPATDKLSIESQKEFSRIVLINYLGETVLERSFDLVQNKTLDISGISNGIYFLQVYCGSELIDQKKVVVSR